MSDLATILLMLATFGLLAISVAVNVRRTHQRCDDVASGVVNGVPMSMKYRWLLLYQDYVGNAFGIVILLFPFVVGFLAAAEVAGDPNVRNVAYACAAAAGWTLVAVLPFAISWVLYLTSVLRQAKAD
jgi:hypothetical protein